MIRVLDYGLGNTAALLNMYKRMNIDARIARSAEDLSDAEGLILPGVGAFDHAVRLLDQSGMRPRLEKRVREDRVPVLGICVGMQMLGDGSDEGVLPGLGWVPGRVRAFRQSPKSSALPLPHMGWNDVRPVAGRPLFAGLETDARFYFLHSYYYDCEQSQHVAATCEYGFPFSCAVASANIFGVQFHPEKSHHFGASLLKNFAMLQDA